jgi:uncharacterized protein (DUF58 family)
VRTREQEVEPLINLSEVTEVELLILKRMREFTPGEHASLFHGSGFDFVGLRDWQAGDRFESIDWAQSSLTNFSPLVVREFEQPTTSGVIIAADRSASTRCGIDGLPIAVTIARAIATIGMSAVFFQDSIGLITFDAGTNEMGAVRPRIGRAGDPLPRACDQAVACSMRVPEPERRSPALRNVMSPWFGFPHDRRGSGELAQVNNVHDVFVVLADAAYAFELPHVTAGWVEAFDVESGRTRLLSRREARGLQARHRVAGRRGEEARNRGLDVLRLGADQTKFDIALRMGA